MSDTTDTADSCRVNEAQQRAVQILVLLSGHVVEGLAQGAIGKAGKWAAPMVHNDLRNLRKAGVAERLGNGNWRLGPRLVQIAISHTADIARTEAQLAEIKQRFSREPR